MIPRKFRVGIDVGTHSVGLAALEIDDEGFPTSSLSTLVVIHDSGVDPSARKQASTRKAVSGVARRTRRLYRRRNERLKKLDNWIEVQGWPIVDLEQLEDPYAPWRARARLASTRIDDEDVRAGLLSISLRHMARHRGWRSPWAKISTLMRQADHSDLYVALRERIESSTDYSAPDNATPAQMIADSGVLGRKLRGPVGILGGKLMQSDNANEIRRIAQVQDLPEGLVREMIEKVFAAESPVGSSEKLVGKDALPGQRHLPRAPRASLEFQRFRVISVLSNLRVKDGGQKRKLNRDELDSVTEYLMRDSNAGSGPTWEDVADVLGVERSELLGTAKEGPEGERVSARPPTNDVAARILRSKVKQLKKWWNSANEYEKETLISYLGNTADNATDEESEASVLELITSFDEDDLAKLDSLTFPAGRAAYSVDSLRRLSDRMLREGVDLYEARRAEFGVDEFWQPPAEPIGTPVGNPAVDRVLKIVARWLMAVERRWGKPESINIEHVRAGFVTEAAAREIDRDNQKRFERNQKRFDEMQKQLGNSASKGRWGLSRYLAIQRQNSQCLYCGDTITHETAEMDHIVPRAGIGSTNTRGNLVAVCRTCNISKSNIPFAVWASKSPRPGVSVEDACSRVDFWTTDPEEPLRDFRRLQSEVKRRLKQTSDDEPIDSRSIESVAWMARELRRRVEHHFAMTEDGEGSPTKVSVYRGSITAEARRASGLEGKIALIGGKGKTRLDRRHHAIDAAVIALMRHSVARTLAERMNLKAEDNATRQPNGWKEYEGQDHASRIIYRKWMKQMGVLIELLNEGLEGDRIPVMTNLRLRLSNSRVHDDKVRELVKRPLGKAFTVTEIDRAATPALWCALTRLPDYDKKKGLPEDPDRKIVVNGTSFGAADKIELFGSSAASVRVRGGYCELSDSVHHARIYRIDGKKPTYAMLRVYAIDLARHRNEDLFSVPLPPQSISVRTATSTLRKALEAGAASYLGWITAGDEMQIAGPVDDVGTSAVFFSEYPKILTWKVVGFDDNRRLKLRPTLMASEGLDDGASEAMMSMLNRGWRVSIGKLLDVGSLTVVRRDALGDPREHTDAHLPMTWQVE